MKKKKSKYIEWLIGELPLLVEQKLISPAQVDPIREYYLQHKKEKDMSKLVLLLLGVFSGLSILTGFILIAINFNWHRIPPIVKAFMALALTGVPLGLCWYTFVKERGSEIFREILALIYTIAFGCTIFFFGQIYHLPSNKTLFLVLWLISSLLIFCIFRTVGSLTFYFVLLYSFLISTLNSQATFDVLLFYPFTGATLLFYRELKREGDLKKLLFADYLYALTLPAGIIFTVMTFFEDYWFPLIMLLFALYCVYDWSRKDYVSHSFLYSPFKTIGAVGTAVLLYILSFKSTLSEIDFFDPVMFSKVSTYIYLFILSAGGVLYAYWLYRLSKKGAVLNLLMTTPLLVIFLKLVTMLTPFKTVLFMIAANLYILALCVHFIWLGYREQRLSTINTAAVLLIVTGFTRFMDIDFDLIGRGIVFIVIGVLFLGANVMLSKKFKSEGKIS
jgi:uncharacterized membrane protein